MITEQGLREQLLANTVARERPDLQEKKEQLIVESAKNRDALYTIESKILEVSLKSYIFYYDFELYIKKYMLIIYMDAGCSRRIFDSRTMINYERTRKRIIFFREESGLQVGQILTSFG